MGRVPGSKNNTKKNKQYKKSHATRSRARDVDQIQDDIIKISKTGTPLTFELDDDLPGLGQFYCTECGRHFSDQINLTIHTSTKVHKRR